MDADRKKVLTIVISVVVILVIIILLVILLGKKDNKIFLKTDNNYKLDFTDKYVEDEYQKVTVTDISVADNYYFIKYQIDLKEKGKQEIGYEVNNTESFSYTLDRLITINGEEIDGKDGTSYQLAKKIDEDTLEVYDIVHVNNIPDKFTIDIDFPKQIDNSMTQADYEEGKQASIEHESTTVDIEGEFAGIYDDPEEDHSTEPDEIDPNAEEIPLEMETIDENVTGIEILGTKNFKGTKQEASQNVEVKHLNNEIQNGDLTVKAELLVKTPFESFLIVNSEIKNLGMDENFDNDPQIYKIDVQDENHNSKNLRFAQKHELIASGRYDEEGDEIVDTIVTTVIALEKEKDSGKLYLQPYYTDYPYQNENIEDILNSLTWHKIDNKEYSEENELGGKITVKSSEERNGELYFTIEATGFNPVVDRMIIIRNPERTIDYCVATEEIVNDNNITVYFEKQQVDSVSENCNSKDVEYTIMEPLNYRMGSDRLEINI